MPVDWRFARRSDVVRTTPKDPVSRHCVFFGTEAAAASVPRPPTLTESRLGHRSHFSSISSSNMGNLCRVRIALPRNHYCRHCHGPGGLDSSYALSGAGVIRRLPLLRTALVLIAAVYLTRGILGIPVVLFVDDPYTRQLRAKITFMVVSSAICVGLGLCYDHRRKSTKAFAFLASSAVSSLVAGRGLYPARRVANQRLKR